MERDEDLTPQERAWIRDADEYFGPKGTDSLREIGAFRVGHEKGFVAALEHAKQPQWTAIRSEDDLPKHLHEYFVVERENGYYVLTFDPKSDNEWWLRNIEAWMSIPQYPNNAKEGE